MRGGSRPDVLCAPAVQRPPACTTPTHLPCPAAPPRTTPCAAARPGALASLCPRLLRLPDLPRLLALIAASVPPPLPSLPADARPNQAEAALGKQWAGRDPQEVLAGENFYLEVLQRAHQVRPLLFSAVNCNVVVKSGGGY